MTLYRPFTAALEKARLLYQKRNRDEMTAVLGDKDGAGARVDIPDMKGFVYCRFRGTPDANGFATYSAPFPVRSGRAPYLNYPGAEVTVAYNSFGELEIFGANYRAFDQAGVDTRSLNPGNQQSKWVYLFNLAIAYCSAVANSVNSSYLITVKKYRHFVNNVFATFETGAQAEKESLQSVVPAADMHRYAGAWLDTYLNQLEITTSTTQAMSAPLDNTDVQETVNERPPDAIPLKAFYLSNNQGSITQQDAKNVDLRQFLNTPQLHGLPNPVAYRERIQPGRQAVYHGTLTVTATLTVLGSVSVLGSGGGSGGSGTVTSVALSEDTDFLEVSGSPVTTSGTLALNRTDGLAANRVVATPNGTTGKVSTRALVADDIPNLPAGKITTGQLALANGGTSADLSSTGGTGQFLKQTSSGNPVSVATIGLSDLPDLVLSNYVLNEASNYTINNVTTFTDVDGTNLSFTLSINSGVVGVFFSASVNTSAGVLKFTIDMDGSDVSANDGCLAISTGGAIVVPVVILQVITGVSVGSHEFKLQWKTSASGAGTMYAGAGTSNFDVHPQFWVWEILNS